MTENLHKIEGCEVCGNNNITPVLNLGSHPMCDDLISVGENRTCKEYPIEILYCQNCNTAHQRFQIPKEELFPDSYHYRSRFTADVLNGMVGLVEACTVRYGNLFGKKIIDIGCNDGSLLDIFKNHGAITIGIEPTGAYIDAAQKGHSVYNDYLSEEVADAIVAVHGKPDIITFTNVFAHIEHLQKVLQSVKKFIGLSTVVVIENHYLGSVLDGIQFDTFYHEHPRTYSYGSFVQIARTLGIEIAAVEFPSRYGGNIRVFLGGEVNYTQTAETELQKIMQREEKFYSQFSAMQMNIDRWRRSKRLYLESQFKIHGKLRAKAFPGRAAILVKLLGLDENLISAVYEKPGSMKIGHYLPGTRIPIYSDDDLFALPDQSAPLLNLAWHIPDEIKKYLAENNYSGPVTDILNISDFY